MATYDHDKTLKMHVVMFPWFAFGHFTPFLHFSNKLAERGHRVSFLLPNKAIVHLRAQNLHPELIKFHPLKVPAVEGLPEEAETASDVPYLSHTLLAKAFDLTRGQVESLVSSLAPDFVFYDLGHWVPELASNLGFKAVIYGVVSPTYVSRAVTPCTRSGPSPTDGYLYMEFGEGITFLDRVKTALRRSDAVCFRTCTEVEGEVVEHLRKTWDKPVLLAGPGLPEEDGSSLDPKWDRWLNAFSPSNVVFCALGTQIVLDKPQFQELVLGFEATGLPFLAVLKPPVGFLSVKEALPEGFEARVQGRGLVYGGWVQQSLILKHASVGCFVSHCGYGSMWEGLVSECQIVGLPYLPDQVVNAKMLSEDMKVSVVVEKEENGSRVSKERLCEAIRSVMDEESEIGLMVRMNHLKYREVLTKEGFMSLYIDKFVDSLQKLKNA